MSKSAPQNSTGETSSSLDEWQDTNPVSLPWFDSPLWGTVMVGCSLLLLVGWTEYSNSRNTPPSSYAGEGAADELRSEAYPLAPVPEITGLSSEEMARPPWNEEPENSSRPRFPIPSQPSTSPSPSKSVSDLIAELTASGNADHGTIKQKLGALAIDDTELARLLDEELQQNPDARRLEVILVAMNGVSYVVSDSNDLKKQVARDIASAGRKVTAGQIAAMDGQAQSMILESRVLPESTEILTKLSATDHSTAHRVLTKLALARDEASAQAAVHIVEANKLDPQLLCMQRLPDFEPVCEFLWTGKLAAQAEFEKIEVGDSEASLKMFPVVLADLVDRNPEAAISPLMSCFITEKLRDALPNELADKIDVALAASATRHLKDGLKSETHAEAKRRAKNGKGPLAFLELATRLNGPKTRKAVALAGQRSPLILLKFESIRDYLISEDDPDTYLAITKIWGIHGPRDSRSNDLSRNIGSSIEQSFLEQLERIRSNQTDRNRQKKLLNLLDAIEKIGTLKSVPALEKLSKTEKSALIKTKASSAIKRIRKR